MSDLNTNGGMRREFARLLKRLVDERLLLLQRVEMSRKELADLTDRVQNQADRLDSIDATIDEIEQKYGIVVVNHYQLNERIDVRSIEGSAHGMTIRCHPYLYQWSEV